MTEESWKKRKQSRDTLAAEHEATLKRVDKTRKKLDRFRRAVGRKTPQDDRRDAQVDHEVSLTLQGALQSGRRVGLASEWSPAVIYRGNTVDPAKFFEPDEDPNLTRVWVPDWKRTGDELKTFAWLMVLAQEGSRARTMNINLGGDVITMAKRAQENRNIGFARFFRDRLSKHLDRELKPFGIESPEFFLWIEASTENKAHVHGGIIMPLEAGSRPVARAIQKAMKKAGGRWNPAEHERQVKIGTSPDTGWGRYISKWRLLTRLQLKSNSTVAATSGLRSRASAWYKNARASGAPIN